MSNRGCVHVHVAGRWGQEVCGIDRIDRDGNRNRDTSRCHAHARFGCWHGIVR